MTAGWWTPSEAEVEVAAAELYEASTGRKWDTMLTSSTRSECATARSMWRMRAHTALGTANKLAFVRLGLVGADGELVTV
jgi:hypothetical protein